MLWFMASCVAVYAVHVGVFYGLVALGSPAWFPPIATITILGGIMGMRVMWDTRGANPAERSEIVVSETLMQILVPAVTLLMLWRLETPWTGRSERVEMWTGSLIYLVVFYALALSDFPPHIAIGAGATMLVCQCVTLVGHGTDQSYGGHRMGGQIK